MPEIPQISQGARNFAKVIIAAQSDPAYAIAIEWFKAGACYMDSLCALILILPDDDPTLAQVLNSLRSGTLYGNDVIARNVLRFDMARDDITNFKTRNVKSESIILHARALVQGSMQRPSSKPSAADFYAALLRLVLLVFRWLPRLAWDTIKVRLKGSKP